jgi:hypothetical protein
MDRAEKFAETQQYVQLIVYGIITGSLLGTMWNLCRRLAFREHSEHEL